MKECDKILVLENGAQKILGDYRTISDAGFDIDEMLDQFNNKKKGKEVNKEEDGPDTFSEDSMEDEEEAEAPKPDGTRKKSESNVLKKMLTARNSMLKTE